MMTKETFDNAYLSHYQKMTTYYVDSIDYLLNRKRKYNSYHISAILKKLDIMHRKTVAIFNGIIYCNKLFSERTKTLIIGYINFLTELINDYYCSAIYNYLEEVKFLFSNFTMIKSLAEIDIV